MEQAPALHAAFMEPSVKKAIDIKMLLSFEEQELIEKVVKLLENVLDQFMALKFWRKQKFLFFFQNSSS
jgi:hypothetical protein